MVDGLMRQIAVKVKPRLRKGINSVLTEFQRKISSDGLGFYLDGLETDLLSIFIIFYMPKFIGSHRVDNSIFIGFNQVRKRLSLYGHLLYFFIFDIHHSHSFVGVQVINYSLILGTAYHLPRINNFVAELSVEIFIKFKKLVCNGQFLSHYCFFTFSTFRIGIVVLQNNKFILAILRKVKTTLGSIVRFIFSLLYIFNAIYNQKPIFRVVDKFTRTG